MNKYMVIILSMFVLAIFTVGCVSAEENVTADIDVPTEEIAIDDSVVETVESEEVASDADVNDEPGNLRANIYVNNAMTSSQIQTTINAASAGDLHTDFNQLMILY